MYADILSGELDLADALFLVAVILAVAAAVLYAVVEPRLTRWAPVALCLAVAGLAFGLMAL
jgi:hypothetical protein